MYDLGTTHHNKNSAYSSIERPSTRDHSDHNESIGMALDQIYTEMDKSAHIKAKIEANEATQLQIDTYRDYEREEQLYVNELFPWLALHNLLVEGFV